LAWLGPENKTQQAYSVESAWFFQKIIKILVIIQLMKIFITFLSPLKVCHSATFWTKI
jgi:hypothetical protein